MALTLSYSPLSHFPVLYLITSPQAVEAIDLARANADVMRQDIDLHILKHDAYGKGFIKTCKISPDAYIQMALQLAYYKVSYKL